jgi:hypothetical protein
LFEGLFPWLPLGLLFVAPFFDPRRPFRLLHLDLLVLASIGGLFLVAYSRETGPGWYTAVPLLGAPGLAYLGARMLFEGVRPRGRPEPLVPYVPVKWLIVAVVILAGARVGYALTDRVAVVNVGWASAEGADLIADGGGIYDGELAQRVYVGDTYGPVNYLAYIPFEQALPLDESSTSDPDAARAAPIVFDLLTLLALFTLGRRLRPGREGELLGAVLAYAWVTFPYTLFVLRTGFNDALVALLLVTALIGVASPVRRGALLALAAGAKFAPGALAPLFARGVGTTRRRSVILFAATFSAVVLIVFAPFIPDGGPREIYDRTLGFQATHHSYCCGIWVSPRLNWLHWLEKPVEIFAVGLALVVAVVPSTPRTLRQLAALAAAVIIAFQLAAPQWLPTYMVWFAPLIFITLFDHDESGKRGRPATHNRAEQPEVPAGRC